MSEIQYDDDTQWEGLRRLYAGAGFLPFANLSASPWKYSAKRVVIIAVILFHRASSAGCLVNTHHTHTHTLVYANAAFDPSTTCIVALFEVWIVACLCACI